MAVASSRKSTIGADKDSREIKKEKEKKTNSEVNSPHFDRPWGLVEEIKTGDFDTERGARERNNASQEITLPFWTAQGRGTEIDHAERQGRGEGGQEPGYLGR